MSKRSGGTNPYMRLSDLGLLTKDHFNEVVKDALASHLSPNENVILVEHRRSPFPKVKGLFQTSLANISADDLKNKDAMFAVLKSLLDEAIEILLLQESELFYRFFSIQQLGLQLDTDEFHEAVARLRNEYFETVKKLLEDVAMSVGVEAPFNTYARSQSATPRGRTMVDGLKPAATEELPDSIPPEPVIKEPSTQRDGLYRIPSPSQKKKRPLLLQIFPH